MSNSVGLEDRRIFERIPFGSLLTFKVGSEDRSAEGVIRNISASGLAFVTKEKLKPKQALELWIDVPDGGNPIRRAAEVVWSKENVLNTHETGTKFDSVALMKLSRVFQNRIDK